MSDILKDYTSYSFEDGARAAKAERTFNDDEAMDMANGWFDDFNELIEDEFDANHGYTDFIEHHGPQLVAMYGERGQALVAIIRHIISQEKSHAVLLQAALQAFDCIAAYPQPEAAELMRTVIGICPSVVGILDCDKPADVVVEVDSAGGTQEVVLVVAEESGTETPVATISVAPPEEPVIEVEPVEVNTEPDVRISVSVDTPGPDGGYANVNVSDPEDLEVKISAIKAAMSKPTKKSKPSPYEL